MRKYFYLIILIFIVNLNLTASEYNKKLTMNGTDPTEIRDRFNFIVGEATFTSSRSLFGFGVNGDKEILPWMSAGIGIPILYSYADYENKFSMGDVNIGLLASFYTHKGPSVFTRLAFGLKYYLNTGNPDIGTGVGQHVLSPRLIAVFYSDEDAFIAPILEYSYSVSNNPDYLKINKLSIRVEGTLNFNEYWINITPELKIDFEGIYMNTYYIRSTIGKMVNKNWGVSADFVYRIAGEPDFDYLGRLNIRYLIQNKVSN